MGGGWCRVILVWLAATLAALPACAEDARLPSQQAQLDQLRLYVEQASAQLRLLNAQLKEAQAHNRRQNQLINRLEQKLSERRSRDPGWQQRWRLDFFALLKRLLPPSPVYRVEADHLIIATDPVFIFSRGEIGAEGRDRLAVIAPALQQVIEQLPKHLNWRLQIEGHTDRRPLRNNPRFSSNWDLSAARALALLDLWRSQGVSPRRLSVLALGDTRPLVAGENKSAFRQNRRLEVRLSFHPLAD